jgi:hypothetical protein
VPINYKQLRGESAPAIPKDGDHQATLDRAKIVDTQNGERLVTEWTTADGNVDWVSWNRFDTSGIEYTRELLLGLGVDLSAIIDDDSLRDQLEGAEGYVYNVRTKSQKGSQGDRWFTSTYATGRADGVQTSMPVTNGAHADVPIDTDGLAQSSLDTKFGDKAPF